MTVSYIIKKKLFKFIHIYILASILDASSNVNTTTALAFTVPWQTGVPKNTAKF